MGGRPLRATRRETRPSRRRNKHPYRPAKRGRNEARSRRAGRSNIRCWPTDSPAACPPPLLPPPPPPFQSTKQCVPWPPPSRGGDGDASRPDLVCCPYIQPPLQTSESGEKGNTKKEFELKKASQKPAAGLLKERSCPRFPVGLPLLFVHRRVVWCPRIPPCFPACLLLLTGLYIDQGAGEYQIQLSEFFRVFFFVRNCVSGTILA